MKITLEFFAQMRPLAGAARLERECAPGTTVASLVAALSEEFGDAFRALALDGEGHLAPSLLASIQGVRVDGARVLQEGDQLLLGTPIAGG